MRKILKKIFKIFGYTISKIKKGKYPIDIPKETIRIYEEVEPYTATSLERVNALLQSVVYITENNIDGEILQNTIRILKNLISHYMGKCNIKGE